MFKKVFIGIIVILSVMVSTCHSEVNYDINFLGIGLQYDYDYVHKTLKKMSDKVIVRKDGVELEIQKPFINVEFKDRNVNRIFVSFSTFNLKGVSYTKVAQLMVNEVEWLDTVEFEYDENNSMWMCVDRNYEKGYILKIYQNEIISLEYVESTNAPRF